MPISSGRLKDMSETKDRRFNKPVSWLLGGQLIASLKSMALYSAHGDKLDARDWMQAEEIDLAKALEAELSQTLDAKKPLWFDFFADTGDGQAGTYSVACLCLRDR